MLNKAIYSALLLISAAANMTVLLDINPFKLVKKEKLLYFLGLGAILIESTLIFFLFSSSYSALYPIIVHIPIIFIFCKISKHSIIKVFFVLLTAVFLVFPGLFIRKLLVQSYNLQFALIALIYIAVCFITTVLVWRFMRVDFNFAMDNFSNRDTVPLCAVPVGYAIIDYVFGYYNLRANVGLIQLVLFLSALGVYSLLLGTFKRTKEINDLHIEHAVMEEQLLSATKHLYDLRLSQEQAAIYRHDMRHHLALLNGYISDNEPSKASAYISQVAADIDAITPEKYCENSTVNLLLAFFVSKARKNKINLTVYADAPEVLPIAETALCALISNGLENALNACAQVKEPENRNVKFKCCMHDRQPSLLILIENNFEISAAMLTQKTAEHGFGTKSIKAITKRLNGMCSFSNDDKIFTLKIILPLS